MASITISEIRQSIRYTPGYNNDVIRTFPWETATGRETPGLYIYPVGNATKAGHRQIFKVAIDLTGKRAVDTLMFKALVKTGYGYSGGGAVQIDGYLYANDPTVNLPDRKSQNVVRDDFLPPAGWAKKASVSWSSAYNSQKNITLQFSNLNITTATTVYLWVELTPRSITYNSTYGWLIDYYDGGEPSFISMQDYSIVAVYHPDASLTLSPNTVTSGNAISVSIGNAYPTETLQFYYGQTLLGSATITNGVGTVTCPASWFDTAGVITSDRMIVRVLIGGTSVFGSFTLVAGSDAAPVVEAPDAVIVQAADASDFPNTYIANYSAAKITAKVNQGTDAIIASVVLSYPGGASVIMEYNDETGKYEAVTPPLTGDTVFTVTALDVRGLTGANTVPVSGVVPYVPPSVTIDEANTWRCDSSGNEESGGLYVRVRAIANYYSALSGNALRVFRFYVQENPSSGDDLVSGVQSAAVLFVPADNYGSVVFEIQDKISGVITKSFRLAGQRRNVTLKRSAQGTYMGVGMLSGRSSGKSCVELPDDGDFLIGGYPEQGLTHLHSSGMAGATFSKNFLNVDTNTMYADSNTAAVFSKAANDSEWTNVPASRAAVNWIGYRRVIWISANCILVEILEMAPESGRVWTNYYNGSWSGWRYTASTQ